MAKSGIAHNNNIKTAGRTTLCYAIVRFVASRRVKQSDLYLHQRVVAGLQRRRALPHHASLRWRLSKRRAAAAKRHPLLAASYRAYPRGTALLPASAARTCLCGGMALAAARQRLALRVALRAPATAAARWRRLGGAAQLRAARHALWRIWLLSTGGM